MAQIGQMYYRIPSSSGYLTAEVKSGVNYDPYTDLIAQIGTAGDTQLNKVGVQAPPGTQMVLNQLKQIMIGRTGIYELDEDIAVTALRFVRPKKYTINEEATESNKAQGAERMQQAKKDYELALSALGTPSTEDDYKRLNDIIVAYEDEYASAYALYTTKEYDVEDGELENVIIDFIME